MEHRCDPTKTNEANGAVADAATRHWLVEFCIAMKSPLGRQDPPQPVASTRFDWLPLLTVEISAPICQEIHPFLVGPCLDPGSLTFSVEVPSRSAASHQLCQPTSRLCLFVCGPRSYRPRGWAECWAMPGEKKEALLIKVGPLTQFFSICIPVKTTHIDAVRVGSC
jgi:hypothetical protein